MQLQIISTRLKVRVERTAEEMLAMGADLQEAKKVCKEDGQTFKDWVESSECPVGKTTAYKLLSVHAELGMKSSGTELFKAGLEVLASVTQTRDEDIRQALLEPRMADSKFDTCVEFARCKARFTFATCWRRFRIQIWIIRNIRYLWHLTESQRAMAMANLCGLLKGSNQFAQKPIEGEFKREDASRDATMTRCLKGGNDSLPLYRTKPCPSHCRHR